MASPWEGGSRPVQQTKSAELASELIASGDHCSARLVATGILDLFESFVLEEAGRRTDTYYVLRASMILTAGMLAELTIKSAKIHRRKQAVEKMIDTWSKMVIAQLEDQGGAN